MNKFLFYKLADKIGNEDSDDKKQFEFLIFKPRINSLRKHNSNILIYIFWYFFTRGKYNIFYVMNDAGKIIHYSHILPKFFKFPFMSKKDLHIGPSWTDPAYRGKGIYPFVLKKTIEVWHNDITNLWMMTTEDNYPSQRGIAKAGFSIVGRGMKTEFLGIYKIENYL